jgi:hypothetical protein
MRQIAVLLMVLAAVLCLASAPATAALVNPSFEEPVISEEGQDGVPTGWTCLWSGMTEIIKDGTAQDGLQYATQAPSTAPNAPLWQISDMVMQVGVTYTATVYARNDRELAGDNAFLTLIADNHTTYLATTAAHAGSTEWVLLTVEYTCTAENAGKYIGVELSHGSAGWCHMGYDNVTLTPEPVTMGLLACGLISLLRRRRQ